MDGSRMVSVACSSVMGAFSHIFFSFMAMGESSVVATVDCTYESDNGISHVYHQFQISYYLPLQYIELRVCVCVCYVPSTCEWHFQPPECGWAQPIHSAAMDNVVIDSCLPCTTITRQLDGRPTIDVQHIHCVSAQQVRNNFRN